MVSTRSFRCHRAFPTALGIALTALVGCSAAPPPEGPTAFDSVAQESAVTARMLAVAAEAADGYRTGVPVHVVVTRGPNPRPEVFRSSGEALRFQSADSVRRVYIGAFTTPPDSIAPRIQRVDSVHVFFSGDAEPWRVPVNEVDLIAWSVPAIDKFVVPYYTALYGPDYGVRTLRQYFQTVDRLIWCHSFMSIECPTMEEEASIR